MTEQSQVLVDSSTQAHGKLTAALERGYFRTLDLFAGCGGMTLGFHRAGFRCVGAIESDSDARASHAANFASIAPNGCYASHGDVTHVPASKAVSHICPLFPEVSSAVDIVIGGPPCQAFSRLGRAALWDIAGQRNAHGQDERATLYHYFLEYVAELEPLAFVMENVREIGKFVGRNVAEEIALTAEELGYNARYALLNAVWYGVPQLRERMFIVGIHRDLMVTPRFPKIRHHYDIPVGYSTSRAGNGEPEVLAPHDHFVDHAESLSRLKPATTASDAFADLPPVFRHLDGRTGRGVPRDTERRYDYSDGSSEFTRSMRGWPGFESDSTFCGHVIRYTPRDYEIFRRMPHGGMYPEALEVAEEIFKEALRERQNELGRKIREGSEEWKRIRKSTVPPYKPGRYPNKFRKMSPDHPARTVPAHIGKDSYSHIHFDSEQARCISLREAARLQSFPDAFRLEGSMNSQLRQIGNAVPPLLAFRVAEALRYSLEGAVGKIQTKDRLAEAQSRR